MITIQIHITQGGLPRLALATGWDVEFDYFIVRRSTDIISEGLGRDDNYGLQVRSKFYTDADPILAYDSRSAITNDTFYIETYLPPVVRSIRQLRKDRDITQV